MTYYIMMSGDQEQDTMFDENILGERSFDKFWAGRGLSALYNIVDKHPELIEQVQIISQQGEKFTIEQFLYEIKTLKIVNS